MEPDYRKSQFKHNSSKLWYIVWINVIVRCGHRGICLRS